MSADPFTDAEQAAMARALVLAERGRGTVRPNPLVGCVIVRDGEIVGEGWHERPGGPHAEVVALDVAGERARGATAFVTLEPCAHTGRTGPCSRALVDAGVAEVVYGLRDPDPVADGGHEALEAAGVRVRAGLLERWAASQNEVFVVHRTSGRPFVTLKLAQTLDGQLRTPRGGWITGRLARTAVHRLRALADVVLVGSGTVVDDDPRLDVRHVPVPGDQPRAVVLDARGRTPLGAQVVRERGAAAGEPATTVVTTPGAPDAWVAGLEAAGVEVIRVPPGPVGGVDLPATLGALDERGVQHVLVEGGAAVAGAFVRAGLVDRLVLHVALTVVGPSGLPAVAAPAAAPDTARWTWHTERVGHLGRDLEVVTTPSLPATQRVAVG